MTHRFHKEDDRKTREQVYVQLVGETIKCGPERSINWVLPIEPPAPDIYKQKFWDDEYSCVPDKYSFLELAFIYNTRRAIKVRQLIHKGVELEDRDLELLRESDSGVQQMTRNALTERKLMKIITAGILLPRENLFCKFLGQGLYDPRIFLIIADFFYEDESKVDKNFKYFETEEEESEYRTKMRHTMYGTALGTYIREAHEDSINWLLPIWPEGFDFRDEYPLRSGGHGYSYESPVSFALERNKPRTLQCLLERGAQIRRYHLVSARVADQQAAGQLLLNTYLKRVMSHITACKPDWLGVIIAAKPLVYEVLNFAYFSNDIQGRRKRKRLREDGYFI